MNRRARIRSLVLIATVLVTGAILAAWKFASLRAADAASANQPEPMEAVTVAVARPVEHRPATTSIGTVIALRSITLRNELAGTVSTVNLTPGRIVEAGTVLVTLDTSVEAAELHAQEAQAVLARKTFERMSRLGEEQAVSQEVVDRARANDDVAVAEIARIKAVIARKTIRAPFRARVGISDVHRGQYLDEGTELTTLQGVDDAVNVDFTVAQRVAAGLRVDERVDVFATADSTPIPATIVAVDARIDATTRNALVRARIDDAASAPPPGASVRVRVPVGPPEAVVAIPASALRKGPGGDHVFVVVPDEDGRARAHMRQVESGELVGDEVMIHSGVTAGEQVAASGSFKLRDGALVAVAASGQEPAAGAADPTS
jgi:membrane fusion protein (multidrug efflux system)